MRPDRRRGFTLIELLLVISIIAILAAVMLPLVGSAMNSQRRGRATGEIAALMGACERHRKLYGDFPCARSGTGTTATSDQPNFRRDLFLQLTGLKRLTTTVATDGSVSLSLTDVTADKARPLLTVEIVTGGLSTAGGETPSNLALCDEFIDPWGNAYDYRYRILNAAGTSTQANASTKGSYGYWLSPDCLIVSCGAKYVDGSAAGTGYAHVPLPGEYWDLTDTSTNSMTYRGTLPVATDTVDGYFTDSAGGTSGVGARADNITSFSGR